MRKSPKNTTSHCVPYGAVVIAMIWFALAAWQLVGGNFKAGLAMIAIGALCLCMRVLQQKQLAAKHPQDAPEDEAPPAE